MDPAIAKQIFDTIYGDVHGYELSFSGRKKMHYYDRGLTYGEILPGEFYQALKDINPQKGEIFYDLGSGTGKAVIMAALLYPFAKVVGIELVDDLFNASMHVLDRLHQEVKPRNVELPRIEFHQKDFVHDNFSDADIVYAHATCFHDGQLRKLIPQFEELKKGTRVLIVSKPLTAPSYRLLKSAERPFSWGKATLQYYEKVV